MNKKGLLGKEGAQIPNSKTQFSTLHKQVFFWISPRAWPLDIAEATPDRKYGSFMEPKAYFLK